MSKIGTSGLVGMNDIQDTASVLIGGKQSLDDDPVRLLAKKRTGNQLKMNKETLIQYSDFYGGQGATSPPPQCINCTSGACPPGPSNIFYQCATVIGQDGKPTVVQKDTTYMDNQGNYVHFDGQTITIKGKVCSSDPHLFCENGVEVWRTYRNGYDPRTNTVFPAHMNICTENITNVGCSIYYVYWCGPGGTILKQLYRFGDGQRQGNVIDTLTPCATTHCIGPDLYNYIPGTGEVLYQQNAEQCVPTPPPWSARCENGTLIKTNGEGVDVSWSQNDPACASNPWKVTVTKFKRCVGANKIMSVYEVLEGVQTWVRDIDMGVDLNVCDVVIQQSCNQDADCSLVKVMSIGETQYISRGCACAEGACGAYQPDGTISCKPQWWCDGHGSSCFRVTPSDPYSAIRCNPDPVNCGVQCVPGIKSDPNGGCTDCDPLTGLRVNVPCPPKPPSHCATGTQLVSVHGGLMPEGICQGLYDVRCAQVDNLITTLDGVGSSGVYAVSNSEAWGYTANWWWNGNKEIKHSNPTRTYEVNLPFNINDHTWWVSGPSIGFWQRCRIVMTTTGCGTWSCWTAGYVWHDYGCGGCSYDWDKNWICSTYMTSTPLTYPENAKGWATLGGALYDYSPWNGLLSNLPTCVGKGHTYFASDIPATFISQSETDLNGHTVWYEYKTKMPMNEYLAMVQGIPEGIWNQ